MAVRTLHFQTCFSRCAEDNLCVPSKHLRLLCCTIAALAAHHAAIAAPDHPSTAPGAYRDWNDEIDQVTIVEPFQAANYNQVAVETFDTTGLNLPNPNDDIYNEVQSALRSIKPAFMDGLQNNLRRKPGMVGGNTLVVRARLIKVDPGSQAARYFGFGAGAVKIAIAGEILDGASQRVFLVFQQERRTGFGVLGGGYRPLLTKTARQIGEDIALLINAF